MAVVVSRPECLNQPHEMSNPVVWSGSIKVTQNWKMTLAGNGPEWRIDFSVDAQALCWY